MYIYIYIYIRISTCLCVLTIVSNAFALDFAVKRSIKIEMNLE